MALESRPGRDQVDGSSTSGSSYYGGGSYGPGLPGSLGSSYSSSYGSGLPGSLGSSYSSSYGSGLPGSLGATHSNPNGSYSVYDESQSTRSKSKSRKWDLGMSDPESKRKKRVASYKVFSVEGKVKASVKKSFRWVKNKYIEIRYGWW